jgi:hypothetical protein
LDDGRLEGVLPHVREIWSAGSGDSVDEALRSRSIFIVVFGGVEDVVAVPPPGAWPPPATTCAEAPTASSVAMASAMSSPVTAAVAAATTATTSTDVDAHTTFLSGRYGGS